jgi:peptidoglycan-N-acetylglucosamine deacetylase
MKKQIIVTTSWDDGHKLDLKLAELLKKYGIGGTFYISPKNREFRKKDLLSDEEIKKLDKDFEIGAHTMTHPRLTKVSEQQAFKEIVESKRYLENLTEKEVKCFCYPAGKYNQKIIKIVKEVGFCYARTIERFCFKLPDDLFLSGVALETYRNSIPDFPINSLRILLFSKFNLIEFYKNLHWEYLAKKMFDYVCVNRGVYHLWGHSWVIERNNDWKKIERVFSYISKRENVEYITNYELAKTIR